MDMEHKRHSLDKLPGRVGKDSASASAHPHILIAAETVGDIFAYYQHTQLIAKCRVDRETPHKDVHHYFSVHRRLISPVAADKSPQLLTHENGARILQSQTHPDVHFDGIHTREYATLYIFVHSNAECSL